MKKHLYLPTILFVVSLTLLVNNPVQAAHSKISPPRLITQNVSTGTPTVQCQAQGAFPDPSCTPGAIFTGVTATEICTPGYAGSVRNVPTSVKNQIYANYGIASHTPGQYEIDHYIPLELGGSNDVTNLWPEPASPQPGFHEKDKVENYLHDQVCSGAMDLSTAENEISTNWVAVYNSIA